MVLVATSLEKLVKLWDEADTFLTSSQYQKGLKLAGDFLRSYAWLNQWSLEKDKDEFSHSSKTSQLHPSGLEF